MIKSLIFGIFVSFSSVAGSSLIVGTWCESGFDVKKCEAVEKFYENGLVIAEGALESEDISYIAKGSWKLDDNKICFNFYFQSIKKISSGEEVKQRVPEYFCNEILSVTESFMRYKSFVNGNIETMNRVK